MAEQEQNRTEQATPFKLQEAKKRGQVAKSLDFNTLVVVAVFVATLAVIGERYWLRLCELCAQLFAGTGTVAITLDNAPAFFAELTRHVFDILLPFMAVGAVAAILANLVQTGPI